MFNIILKSDDEILVNSIIIESISMQIISNSSIPWPKRQLQSIIRFRINPLTRHAQHLYKMSRNRGRLCLYCRHFYQGYG